MMKIIFVCVLYIFFVFLIKYKVIEKFADECPASCKQEINNQISENIRGDINNIQIQIKQLSSQLSNIEQKTNDANIKATSANNLATTINQEIENIKKKLTEKFED